MIAEASDTFGHGGAKPQENAGFFEMIHRTRRKLGPAITWRAFFQVDFLRTTE